MVRLFQVSAELRKSAMEKTSTAMMVEKRETPNPFSLAEVKLLTTREMPSSM